MSAKDKKPGTAEAPPEEEPVSELTATQYVILAENQRKKRALAEATVKFHRLADENRGLLKEWDEAQAQNYEVTEHLRSEVVSKNERIITLENEILKLEALRKTTEKELLDKAAVRETKLKAEWEAKQRDMQGTINGLEAELNKLNKFSEEYDTIMGELISLRTNNASLSEELSRQKEESERYHLSQMQVMKNQADQRIEELKRQHEEEFEARLDANVKRILRQNRSLAGELQVHVEETELLQLELKGAEQDRSRLARDLSLKLQLEEGYAKRGAQQSIALKEARARAAAMELALEQAMAEFAKEKETILSRAQAQVADHAAEAEALRRLIKLKTKELKHVRHLAQEVLLQRSDVEVFLLSSLHAVRSEIERPGLSGVPLLPAAPGTAPTVPSSRGTFLPPPGTAGTFGGASSRAAGAFPPPGTAGTMGTLGGASTRTSRSLSPGALGSMFQGPTVADLSWEEREQVLKLLFAKVQSSGGKGQSAALPPHSLDGGGGVFGRPRTVSTRGTLRSSGTMQSTGTLRSSGGTLRSAGLPPVTPGSQQDHWAPPAGTFITS